ncbi:odorant receptor Or2-like isoform X8 [Maniola hyperantus]|uniref:odorant receptor Or2-like isoform X8 n=1 Tax=Aphantopus hyperantus TaxID=2795564 RepID=UPI00374971C2
MSKVLSTQKTQSLSERWREAYYPICTKIVTMVLMTFFAGQLDLLKLKCSLLFGDGEEDISYRDAVKRIRDCHQHHVLLVKYSKIMNSLLSPVLFLYVIICSLMICASAVQLTTDGTTSMQQVWIAEYLLALVAQLFLYCWHSNKVLFMSLKVDEGVYSSAWWSQGARVRRSVALLGGQLAKTVVFTAGPFTKLTAATFITTVQNIQFNNFARNVHLCTRLFHNDMLQRGTAQFGRNNNVSKTLGH